MGDLGQHFIPSQEHCVFAYPHYFAGEAHVTPMKRNSHREVRNLNDGKLLDFVRDGLEAHRRASRNVKANALKQLGKPKRDRKILSAIKNKEVLRFKYNGRERIVEPQTYGISIAGREVLRAYQIGGGSRSGQLRLAKLFELQKISNLRKAGTVFEKALPAHNPRDSAMVEVFATLAKPKK
jgi:hypothetical protein